MDRRTLLLVLGFSILMFGVNYYFEHQREEKMQEWRAQQRAKNSKEIETLKEDIEKHTAKPAQLPLTKIYSDASNGQFLTGGVQVNNSILTMAWTKNLPQKVYSNGQEYQIIYTPDSKDGLVVYQKNKEAITVSKLPYFGTFELQLVVPHTIIKQPFSIYIGNFTDGSFNLLQKKLEHLKAAESDKPLAKTQIGDGILLMKSGTTYVPIGVYHSNSNSLVFLEEFAGLKTETPKQEMSKSEKSAEKLFVLENEYMQLVISNRGAAITEINLPFESEKNKKSIVKEIEYDRDIIEYDPQNAYFPLEPYYTSGANNQLEEHTKGTLGGYYPLLRRDFIQTKKHKSIKLLPKFYAFNIVSEYPEMAEIPFEITHFDKERIILEAKQPNRTITKTYTLSQDPNGAPYIFNLSIKIDGDSRGLWLTSGVPEVEWINNGIAPAIKYHLTRKGKSEVTSIDLPKESLTVTSTNIDWISNSNGFLGLIMDPLSPIDSGYRVQYIDGATVPSRLLAVDEEYDLFTAQNLPGYLVMLPLKASGGTMNFRIYAGPFTDGTLKAVDKLYSDPSTGYNPDYVGSQTFHGWFAFISAPFAKFLFILMKFFHSITGSWGFSIILLTVALRIMMYPLNAWSTKSMLRMQQIAPEVTKIQEKYKKDPKKAQLEIMNLYRERGVNPISGCFPLLIQMPFLIGMFDLLKSTFELRGASFIPGWIDNLAAPDVLFSWSYPIPFIGNQFHLLPILLGFVMFAQQRFMTPSNIDTSQMTEQQRQQRAMGTMMSVIFTVMFYKFPSGLNIYWLSSMLLGILQQWWTNKRMQSKIVTVKQVK